jgi:acyl carrier protein
MQNIEQRVAHCFSNVFPDLRSRDIPSARAGAVEAWDSVAHITLLSAISEEFGIEFEIDDYEELTSYPAIVSYLEKANSNSN